MAKFKYSARTKEGELQVGNVEAASKELAVNILTSHNLYVLSVESAEKIPWHKKILGFRKRVKLAHLMIFTRQFATLLESGVSVIDAMKNLYKQTNNEALQEAIYQISLDIGSGLSLSQAMERQGEVFSEFYISMIKSAEITGRLQEAMSFLADYLDKEVVWVSRIRNALIYPAFVLATFFVVLGIMVIFIFPQLRPVFQEFNVKLPLVTQIMLGAGNFIFSWWWALLFIGAIFIFFLADYFRGSEGKAVIGEIMIRTPVLGELFKKIYIARFAEITGVLIKGGVPVSQSLEIASHSIGNAIYQEVIHEIAERVRAGEQLSQTLSQNEYFFPALTGQMTAIGEVTGKLDDFMLRIATFYTREVNATLDNLVELIQPTLIVLVGLIVGLLFAAIILPIFDLTQGF